MKSETLSAIKQAIFSEIEGYEFYKLAAKDARDPFVKETYLSLAEEERKHVEWLQGLLKKLDNDDHRVELESIDPLPSPELFQWKNLDREDPKTTLSVFGIALQLEKSSYEFYHDVAEKAEDKDVKELFGILEAWEKAHYAIFDKEYKRLQEDWWHEQRFAPF